MEHTHLGQQRGAQSDSTQAPTRCVQHGAGACTASTHRPCGCDVCVFAHLRPSPIASIRILRDCHQGRRGCGVALNSGIACVQNRVRCLWPRRIARAEGRTPQSGKGVRTATGTREATSDARKEHCEYAIVSMRVPLPRGTTPDKPCLSEAVAEVGERREAVRAASTGCPPRVYAGEPGAIVGRVIAEYRPDCCGGGSDVPAVGARGEILQFLRWSCTVSMWTCPCEESSPRMSSPSGISRRW